MRLVLIVLIAGCQQGGAKHQPPGPAPVIARAIDAAQPNMDARVVMDARVDMLEEALHEIETKRSSPRVCFAISENHRRVACVSQSSATDADGPSNIVILGDVGTARSEWTFDEIADVRRALAERKYVAFDSHGVDLVKTATVGTFKLRRNRKITIPAVVPRANQQPGDPDFVDGVWNTYADGIELACGSRWVDAHLDDLLIMMYGDDIPMHVSLFDDHRILLEVEGSWGIEGAHGSVAGAQMIDVAALCK